MELSEYLWSRFTNCISFNRCLPVLPDLHRRQVHTFHSELQTDGIRVTVVMLQPQPAPPPSALAQTLPTHTDRERVRQQQTSTDWVKDLTNMLIRR